MELGDILGPDNGLPDMQATDRWQAIDELIAHLVVTNKIPPEHRAAIAEVVKERERSMSTGIGSGIAIPHGLTALTSKVVGVIGRSKRGMDFGAPDNQPVKTVLLFVAPQGQFQAHLHSLANIAKLLHKTDHP